MSVLTISGPAKRKPVAFAKTWPSPSHRHAHNYIDISGIDSLGGSYSWFSPGNAVPTGTRGGLGLVTASGNRQSFTSNRFTVSQNGAQTFLWHFVMGATGSLQALVRGLSSSSALYVLSGGALQLYESGPGFYGSASLTTLAQGNEYTVAWTREAGSSGASNVYINGSLEIANVIDAVTTDLGVGFDAWGDAFNQILTGAKLQFHAFERVLSPQEIAAWNANRWSLFEDRQAGWQVSASATSQGLYRVCELSGLGSGGARYHNPLG